MSEAPVAATHTMTLVGQAESGAEEWACPSCGRRMLLRWPPNYQKLVLDEGDESAVHVGGKGGLQMSSVGVVASSAGEVPPADLRWLRDNGIDWGDVSA